MRRKFAVALDSSTDAQRAELRKFIKDNGLGWWHWINNFWLLTDQNGRLTAKDIRSKLGEICPGVRCVVLSLDKDGDAWSGFGPKSAEKNMFTWLKETWDKDLN
ncbi:hypothetical protein ACX3OY_22670 [Citrobacter farmeri]|uniref:hypothetical protein n=1 Tax=Citrobacter farmeri TaxID=67824 RepID=UPI001E3BF0EC|nr:hypothetical protein [Citrobacter farmeri]GJL47090.1 hypothetical protein TUM17580_31490 [Citrobacter farmeri]